MSKEMKKNPVKVKKGTAGRLIKTLFGFYPVLMPLTQIGRASCRERVY